MSTSLEDLPVELLAAILENLDGKDLVRCSMVSKTFSAVVKESAHLQYPIELKAAGMENVSSNHADIVTKLALLRKYQHVVQNQTLPTFKFIYKIESFNYHWPNLRTRFWVKLYGVAFSLITGHPHDLAAPALGEIPIFESMPNEQRCIYSLTVIGETLFVLVKSRHDSEDSSEYYGPLSGNRIPATQPNRQTGKREMDATLQLPMVNIEGTTYYRKHNNVRVIDKSHIAIGIMLEVNDVERMVGIDVIDLERLKRGCSLRDSTLVLEFPTPVDPDVVERCCCRIFNNDPGTSAYQQHPSSSFEGGDYKGLVPIRRIIELSSGEKRTLKWEEWGVPYSRVFDGNFHLVPGVTHGPKAIIATWKDDARSDDDVRNNIRTYEFIDFVTTSREHDTCYKSEIGEYVTTPTEIIPVVPMTCGDIIVTGTCLPYRRYPVKLSPHPKDVGSESPPPAYIVHDSILIEHCVSMGWSIYVLDYSVD
ncbi:hypothetical protein ABKN59_008140 [Abortiporus biennis]